MHLDVIVMDRVLLNGIDLDSLHKAQEKQLVLRSDLKPERVAQIVQDAMNLNRIPIISAVQ